MSLTEEDIEVEQYKIKKILTDLGNFRGNGTSLITIMIQAGGDINGMKRLLVDEYGTATNIKSRVNRQSVLGAITSAQHKLKQFNQLPPNGLVLYCGEPFSGKKISVCFQPFKPLQYKMYMCDSRFHTEPLGFLLQTDEKFGFIVIDGNGALFGMLSGTAKSVLYHYKVQLPKKHKKGGQSAARFGRLAQEARQLYISKIAEMATKYYIGDDNMVNVKGIIVAGSAEMKDKLNGCKELDGRVKVAIVSVLTISYGGINGFDEAISKSGDVLNNLRFMHEKKELQVFFESLNKDDNNICYGAKDTMQALEIGAVQKILVCDKMHFQRLVIKGTELQPGDVVLYPNKVEDIAGILENYQDRESTYEPLIDWLVENYKKYGANIVILSDQTPEGTQFYRGFGGLAGILRWTLKFEHYNMIGNDGGDSEDSDFI